MNIFPEQGEVESPGGKERMKAEFSGFPGSAVRERGFFLPAGEHEIHVSMQQADMPSGLSQFLQLLPGRIMRMSLPGKRMIN